MLETSSSDYQLVKPVEPDVLVQLVCSKHREVSGLRRRLRWRESGPWLRCPGGALLFGIRVVPPPLDASRCRGGGRIAKSSSTR